jgi:hypothetical protein
MTDFEKLGVFYLGRPYDLELKKPKEGLLLLDSKDLVTHAVCVGMTGSGKTGLCIAMLEEAAIDGIPAIAIDPKGDLTNLMLSFPGLTAEEFLPWINEDDARRKELSAQDYALQQAALWKRGLADWGQSGDRIQRMRQSADFAVYTPGSTAGIPISIVDSFAAPGSAILEDPELLGGRIAGTVAGMLGLLGLEADPLQSREHILLSTIIRTAWTQGKDLDMPGLIQQIQSPPFNRIGILDLESFFPSKERFGLALRFNNLLAAPGFDIWMKGQPLDIGALLHTDKGKPRVSIISIAHLDDSQRMFVVSLILNQVLSWIRNQSGTGSLRALLYMDEIFGYFPPVANPPSKQPLLTLLKQARAFGLGIVLATQNPVDLDYKGLSNAGTWFIGRLQTERDKARVLDGLEGAAATGGAKFDRQALEQTLAGLGSRIFLMNNVHNDAPEIFETRWTLSYLRGPMTRDQIKKLPGEAPGKAVVDGRDLETKVQREIPAAAFAEAAAGSAARPVLPGEIVQSFIPYRGSPGAQGRLVYVPMILGSGKVFYADAKTGLSKDESISLLAQITDPPASVDWQQASSVDLTVGDLEKTATENAVFAPLPASAARPASYAAWRRALQDSLFRTRKLELLKSPSSGALSNPAESEKDFRLRLQHAGREERDAMKEKLRQKYATRIASLDEKIRRAELIREREAGQAQQQKLQTAISFGATLLGAFMGRKTISAGTLGRAATAARGVGRTMKESQDVSRAQENIASLRQQLADLDSEFQAEAQAVELKSDPMTETLQTVIVRPKKTDVSVSLLALAWAPYWQGSDDKLVPAWE